MATLHDILWNLTNDELGFRLRLLERKPLSPRKADLIDAIKTCYSGSGLCAIWSSMSELEQKAVAEACYASEHAHHETRFKAKYGSLPPFCSRPKDVPEYHFTSWDSKRATRLNLLLYSSNEVRSRVVPADLAERLRQFVPKPPDTTVPTLAEPVPEEGLCVRLTEHAGLSEVMALLRLAEQGNLKISAATGMPSAAGCGKILECLTDGDFFPHEVAYLPNKKSYEQEIGPIKPVGWARLLQAGKYIAADGAKSKLTPSGVKALSQAPHEIIRHLWARWLDNSAFDEFNRIDVIKGQSTKGHMTAKPPRRKVIAGALLGCAANEWIDAAKFSCYMQAEGFEFEVSNDLGKLYLCEQRYGNFDYSGYGDWNIVQFRYLLCLLFEYAASLGLIDIAYVHPELGLRDFLGQWGADDLAWLSRYDGLRAFRITNLGAYCFGMVEDFKAAKPISALRLSVLPNLCVRILSGSPNAAERFLLETWAESVAAGTWRLEPVRARAAIERGQSVADLTAFLSQCDDQPLPETVEGFLKTCESDGTALRNRGEAQLFECRDAKTAAVVCAQKDLLNLCFRIGETHLVVPSMHLTKFRKVARSLGLGIV